MSLNFVKLAVYRFLDFSVDHSSGGFDCAKCPTGSFGRTGANPNPTDSGADIIHNNSDAMGFATDAQSHSGDLGNAKQSGCSMSSSADAIKAI